MGFDHEEKSTAPAIKSKSNRQFMKTLRQLTVSFLWIAAACLSVSAMAQTPPLGTITYIHNDLLGSPAAATNAAGVVIWREAYRGYGERLKNEAGATANKVWYTSRHQDEDTGLVYMGARYYDPALGRFLSADSVGFSELNSHSFNRYSYAYDNPSRFKDPDGRTPLSIALLEVAKQTGAGYLLGVAADSVSQYAAFGEVSLSLAATSNAAVAGGASGLLSGAVSGALKGFAALANAKTLAAVDQNKLKHIFGKSEHNLNSLVSHFGSEEKAFVAMQEATGTAVRSQGIKSVFELPVKIGVDTVTVRGTVVDDAVKIGTAFIP